jgi:hypothetical protein
VDPPDLLWTMPRRGRRCGLSGNIPDNMPAIPGNRRSLPQAGVQQANNAPQDRFLPAPTEQYPVWMNQV